MVETRTIASPSEAGSRWVVLYDGRCAFCTASMQRLLRLCAPGSLEPLDLHDASVAERFPDLDPAALLSAMHVVAPDGRVRRGMAAIVALLATRWWGRPMAWMYALPGIRWVMDRVYAFLARRRYRLLRRRVERGECDGACAVHAGRANS